MAESAIDSTPFEWAQAPLHTVWGYVRHELLYLTWAVMDVALLTPVAIVWMSWARYWPDGQLALWLLLLMLLPFNLARLMSLLRVSRERQQVTMFVSLLLTLLLTMRSLLYTPQSIFDFTWLGEFYFHVAQSENQLWQRDVAVFLLTVFMWWRGIQLVGKRFGISRAGLRLRVGGLLLAPLVIWIGSERGVDTLPFISLFLLAGLAAVSLIRVEQLEFKRSGRSATFNARWLAGILAAALLVVATGALLASIVSGRSVLIFGRWLSPLWSALYFGIAATGTTFFYLMTPLLYALEIVLRFLSELLGRMMAAALSALAEAGLTLQQQTEILPSPTPGEFVEVTGPGAVNRLVIISLMVVVVALVSFSLWRLYRHATLAASEVSDSGRGAAAARLQKPGLGERLLARLGLLRHWRTAVSIRRIYQQMCAAAETIGYPRAQAETPFEYLHTLAEVWPENQADTRTITDAYVKVRYGEVPETKEELEQIKAAWERLQTTTPAPGEGNRPHPRLQKVHGSAKPPQS